MSETFKIKDASAFVKSVLTLDSHFSELERLSARIDEMDLKSEFDLTQIRKLMNRFSECGQSVSTDIIELATQLNESRARAEAAAELVAKKAQQLQERQNEQDSKMEAFQALTAKVHKLGEEALSLA